MKKLFIITGLSLIMSTGFLFNANGTELNGGNLTGGPAGDPVAGSMAGPGVNPGYYMPEIHNMEWQIEHDVYGIPGLHTISWNS